MTQIELLARAIAGVPDGELDPKWIRKARDGLLAIREPSGIMIAAGEPIVYDCHSLEPGEGLDENPAIPTWQAMIDAMLNEPET